MGYPLSERGYSRLSKIHPLRKTIFCGMVYGIYFKQRDVQYMLMVIVASSLILILTDVSGVQQKSDIII